MKIGIIDADLIDRQEHNFPNLACMKISGFYKELGHDVKLIGYGSLEGFSLFPERYDKVYIAKVFTETKVPDGVLDLPFVVHGGTGFYFDKAENLPDEIEHSFPDYHLYDNWIEIKISNGKKKDYFKYYTDFSIGFTTRGCFRKCDFCVIKKYDKAFPHSPLSEFVDKDRKKICLLDDNILSCGEHWERIILELQATKKRFQFKQGLDIRLMTPKKAELLANSKYEGNYIYAFDNIADADMIEKRLSVWKKYHKGEKTVLYCLCAFDRTGKYDADFWLQDIIDLFERTRILMKYDARPYVMRFERWVDSPWKYLYIVFSSWVNGSVMFYSTSFRENAGDNRAALDFAKQYPEIAEKYYDMKAPNKITYDQMVELSLFDNVE